MAGNPQANEGGNIIQCEKERENYSPYSTKSHYGLYRYVRTKIQKLMTWYTMYTQLSFIVESLWDCPRLIDKDTVFCTCMISNSLILQIIICTHQIPIWDYYYDNYVL